MTGKTKQPYTEYSEQPDKNIFKSKGEKRNYWVMMLQDLVFRMNLLLKQGKE